MGWDDCFTTRDYDHYMSYDDIANEEPEEDMTEITVDGEPIDYLGLPANHRETARAYIEGGYRPGSGWLSILQCDLRAVVMVDADTLAALPQIVRWLHNHAPAKCFGSAERVSNWMEERRAERVAAA